MTTTQTVDELHKITAGVKASFGGLAAQQLNWKPAPDKWSIGQCLHHLIVSNETYYPQFNEIVSGSYCKGFYQSIKPLSSFLGRRMIRDLGPVKTKDYKNPVMFAPSASDIPASIVVDFEAHQQLLSLAISAMSDVDLEETVIYSPVTKVIIYSLADVFELLVVHEQRHVLQAKRMMEMSGFPA